MILLGIVASLVANPEMWWARLAPQMWLLPVLASARAIKAGSNKYIAVVIACVMGATSLIAAGGRVESAALTTARYQNNLRRVGQDPLLVNTSLNKGFFLPALGYRLSERGASYRISQIQCNEPIKLIVIEACLSGGK